MIPFRNDPRVFRDLLEAKLSNGESGLTLDEALGVWEYENQTDAERYENQTDAEREDTLRAIRQGLADVDAGRVRPLEEFDREFRLERERL